LKNDKIYQDFLEAKESFKQKNIEKSYLILKKLMKKDSEDYAIRFEFAKILIEMNNLTRAKKILESLLNSKNRNYAILELGKIAVIEGDLTKARNYFESLLNTSNMIYSLIELGKLENLEGNYLKAQTCFYKTLSAKCNDNKCCAIQEILNLNIKLANYEKSLIYLNKLINMDENIDSKEVEKYKFYLKYKLNKISELNKIDGYFNNQLIDYSSYRAIKYIEYNTVSNKNLAHNVFNDNVNINLLFNKMQEKIKKLIPVNFGIYDKYTIELENVIGNVRNINSNLLCVVTICDTKNIIYMYPVLQKNKLNNKPIKDSKKLILN